LSVNRDRKRTGVPVVAVNGAVGFPNAVSMSGGMIVVTDEENFRPEILVERVLGLNNGQIIAGRNDTTVQNDKVGIARGKNDGLLRAAAKGNASEEDGGVIRTLPKRR